MYGVIDIGTNSVLFLEGYYRTPEEIVIEKNLSKSSRLGSGLQDESPFISESSLKRTISILNHYKKISNASRGIHVIGTYIFRKAANSDWAIERIERTTGFKVNILSEQEEALYSFRGVQSEDKKIAVLDVGGGSSELVLANREITSNYSFHLGSLTLYEKFKPNFDNLPKLLNFIDSKIILPNPADFKDTKLIVVGGSATTLALIKLQMAEYNFEKVHNTALTDFEIRNIFYKILSKPFLKRSKIVGLSTNRRDIIIPGIAIILRIMRKLKKKSITVRETGLRFGYLKKIISDDTYREMKSSNTFFRFSIKDETII